MPRTTLEGQGNWNLQLNPVLVEPGPRRLLHYQADNATDTELDLAELTAGAVYQPSENLSERRARLGQAQALGHRHRRRPADHPEQHRPLGARRLQLHVPDDLTFLGNAHYTTAAPDPQLSAPPGGLRPAATAS